MTGAENHTVLRNMLADLGHGIADVGIRVQQVVVLLRLPIRECRQLLRDGLEQTNNHSDGRGLHVIAELLDGSGILAAC